MSANVAAVQKGNADRERVEAAAGPVVAARAQPIVILLAALAAGIVAALADGAPTGLTPWDIILKAALAALFVYAAAASSDRVVIVIATVAAVFVGSGLWLAPALLGLVLAIGAGVLPASPRWMTVAAAALAVQGLLRIPDIGFFGLPSLIAGFAITVMLLFGYAGSSVHVRRRARRSVVTLTVVAMLISAIGGLTLFTAKADVDRGIAAARAGLSAARGGDPVAVAEELAFAADALEDAQGRADGLLTQPLRLVPIAAQHRQAVVVATTQGRDITRQASQTTIDADIASVSMNAGSIDLAALSSMESDLASTVNLLETGVLALDTARSRWLVPPIASRLLNLTDEMRAVLPEARVAADAARVLPGMLGQDGARRYFVAFGSPTESRELGGFVGSWALVEFDAGRVRQVEAGRIADLYDLTRSQEPVTRDEYPRWFAERMRPHQWPQNLTGSPSLATVAAASAELLDGIAGGPIDGFVYVDAYALSAILKITGPLRVEGVTGQINTNNVTEFLFDEQFRLENRETLKSQASEIFGQAFDDLVDAQLPGPERLGRVLGPSARQGRLQIATFDADENAFLQSVQLQREFGWPLNAADSFAVIQNNGLQNKLDLYLEREITYDATVDAAGGLVVSGVIEVTSAIPDDAPEYVLGDDSPGVNLVYLSLFTPHRLSSVSIDGESVDPSFTQEFGYNRNEFAVVLSPNMTQVITFELIGQVDPTQPYDVSVWHQPLVNNDVVHLSYTDASDIEHRSELELVEVTVVSFD